MKRVETRLSEIRYRTSDTSKMLGKFIARRVLKTWIEEFMDEDKGKIVEIERTEILFEKGTYIDNNVLSSIKFYMEEGSVTEIEVSNQKRLAISEPNGCFYPYKAVARIEDKRRSFLLYATSIANALVILTDYIELNYRGGFTITDIKEMDYCTVIIDRLKSVSARKYEVDRAYLNNEISVEEYTEATCDAIMNGNPDSEEGDDNPKEQKKFYQISAHIVLHDEKEGDDSEDSTFIVQTISAARANLLIETHLRRLQEERYQESLKHPERTFVRRQINSFIEESKIIPIGCFIPKIFSEAYYEPAENDS